MSQADIQFLKPPTNSFVGGFKTNDLIIEDYKKGPQVKGIPVAV